MNVKADMHIHTNEDPLEKHINYGAKELIDKAYNKGFGIISITHHDSLFDDKKIKDYAESKSIMLIKGIEKSIQKRHVLIYGANKEELKRIRTFNDLKKLKNKKNILVVAPHPFFPNVFGKSCLRNKVFKHKDLFDALEVQQIRTPFYNPNKKAIRFANKLKKGLVGNSDAHFLNDFGEHYTLIKVPKNFSEKDVFDAVKNKKTELIINKNNYKAYTYIFKHLWFVLKKKIIRI